MFEVLDKICEPKRCTRYSAYVDLFSREDCIIGAGETKVIKLGVKIDVEQLKKMLDISHLGHHYKKIERIGDELKNRLDIVFEHFLKSHYIEVALRSSLAVKGLIIANGIGIIDLDYPDEIGLIVHNPVQIKEIVQNGCNYTIPIDSDDCEFLISKGDKVAQCTIKEHKGYLMGYESDVIRDGGFGSTGK
jgi:dUTPase